MGRSGYSDDYGWPEVALYRGQVLSAMRGKRGQIFFRDLIEALDAMPTKRLIADDLVAEEAPCDTILWLFADCAKPFESYERRPNDLDYHKLNMGYQPRIDALQWFRPAPKCGVCALGALGQRRGVNMRGLDPEDAETVGATFNIAESLAREAVYENDERLFWDAITHHSRPETPEERWTRMRGWAVSHLRGSP